MHPIADGWDFHRDYLVEVAPEGRTSAELLLPTGSLSGEVDLSWLRVWYVRVFADEIAPSPDGRLVPAAPQERLVRRGGEGFAFARVADGTYRVYAAPVDHAWELLYESDYVELAERGLGCVLGPVEVRGGAAVEGLRLGR